MTQVEATRRTAAVPARPARTLAADPGPVPEPAPPIYRQLTDERLHDPRTPDVEETPVSEHRYRDDPIPVSRDVFDPDLGADGGGQHADGLPAFDPAHDEADLYSDVAPAVLHDLLRDGGIVACPSCGTGVHPSRITG